MEVMDGRFAVVPGGGGAAEIGPIKTRRSRYRPPPGRGRPPSGTASIPLLSKM